MGLGSIIKKRRFIFFQKVKTRNEERFGVRSKSNDKSVLVLVWKIKQLPIPDFYFS